MQPLSLIFLLAVLAGTATRLWLANRQIAAVTRHRAQVPEPFADTIAPEDHHKAADYALARTRLGRIDTVIDAIVLLALTLGGGIEAIDRLWRLAPIAAPWHGALVILSVMLVVSVIALPLSLWSTFGLEARFGFNRTSLTLFFVDRLKGLVLGLLIGGPLLLAALELMRHAGALWWLYVWALWLGVSLGMTWAYPALIAPLFNRFSPLADAALRIRIETLLTRCGFASRGVFVIDGSRRSAHGNAYFTGVGRNKRIVFFDTLMSTLEPAEIEAVLAHELGHFKLHHIRRRLIVSAVVALAGLALLGWLAARPWFYAQLGLSGASDYGALLLFMFVAPAFTFFVTPLAASWSRRDEFAADEFAAQHTPTAALMAALVKLYRDNATTLTPDHLHSQFYDSHPPALARIARLRELSAPG
ncbi:MAG TPA: M48 family metallopeptidase [Steroidobacteraceae bacterium]|nr:M48 family metallopeptidase [Steroidobacteraceae bacterium]